MRGEGGAGGAGGGGGGGGGETTGELDTSYTASAAGSPHEAFCTLAAGMHAVQSQHVALGCCTATTLWLKPSDAPSSPHAVALGALVTVVLAKSLPRAAAGAHPWSATTADCAHARAHPPAKTASQASRRAERPRGRGNAMGSCGVDNRDEKS